MQNSEFLPVIPAKAGVTRLLPTEFCTYLKPIPES